MWTELKFAQKIVSKRQSCAKVARFTAMYICHCRQTSKNLATFTPTGDQQNNTSQEPQELRGSMFDLLVVQVVCR